MGELSVVSYDPSGTIVQVKIPPPEQCAVNIRTGEAVKDGQDLHLILEVKDNGTPSLVTYKQVVIQITNYQLRGGFKKAYKSMTETAL